MGRTTTELNLARERNKQRMAKPYQQGFNEATGDILIVCSPDDVQEAIGDYYEDEHPGKTITRERAIELMQENEEALTYSYQHGYNGEWMQSIQDVLASEVVDTDFTQDREEN